MRDVTPSALEGLSILVVEDEQVFRHQLTVFLTKQGASISAVEDGEFALAALHQHQFDVIILDIMMPRVTGIQLLEKIKGQFGGCIIAVSGKSCLSNLREVMRLGASDFLIKPLGDFNELVETILTSVARIEDTHLQLEFAEFTEHREELSADDQLASKVLDELLPPSPLEAVGYFCHYRMKGKTLFPLVYILDSQHVAFVIADIGLIGDEGAVAAVLLNGFFKETWLACQEQQDYYAISPADSLKQLNSIIYSAGLRAPVGCLYGIITPEKAIYSNAGLLDVPNQLNSVHPGMGLGLSKEAVYQVGQTPFAEIGFSLSFKNMHHDRLTLKLFPTEAYAL